VLPLCRARNLSRHHGGGGVAASSPALQQQSISLGIRAQRKSHTAAVLANTMKQLMPHGTAHQTPAGSRLPANTWVLHPWLQLRGNVFASQLGGCSDRVVLLLSCCVVQRLHCQLTAQLFSHLGQLHVWWQSLQHAAQCIMVLTRAAHGSLLMPAAAAHQHSFLPVPPGMRCHRGCCAD